MPLDRTGIRSIVCQIVYALLCKKKIDSRSSGDLKSKIFHGHKASMAGTSVSSYDPDDYQEKSPSISSLYHPSTSKLVATAKMISSGKSKTPG